MTAIRSFVVADAVGQMPDGKTMIVGAGIGRIRAQKFPWAVAQLGAFVTIEVEGIHGTGHSVTAEVLGPDDDVLAGVRGELLVDPGATYVNFAPVFAQLQLAEAGRHWVRVLLDEEELGRYALEVELEPQQSLFEPLDEHEPHRG
jgi:hypothetical protein